MKNSRVVCVAGVAGLCGIAMAQPTDSFHLMQVEQIIGGVNGDTTKQAVQLRMRSSFQELVSQGRVVVYDATGANRIVIKDMTTDVSNGEFGDRVLLASESFVSATTPACVPDFVMTTPIPSSYLAAGRLTWEDDFGTILWSVAWGGAAYTGPDTGSLVNSPTGNFGPPFAGPCPTTGFQALLFQGTAAAAAGSNSTDYALTAGPSVWTSNSHATFTVTGGVAPCYPNCDGSTTTPFLNANDFQCFLNAFAAGMSYANCDGSTVAPILNANDFQCFLNQIGM